MFDATQQAEAPNEEFEELHSVLGYRNRPGCGAAFYAPFDASLVRARPLFAILIVDRNVGSTAGPLKV
jgi:hypothetical protein